MDRIPFVKHVMFRTYPEGSKPELEAWVRRTAELVDAYAAFAFEGDDLGHQLTSFVVQTAADLVWDGSEDAGVAPCWSRLRVNAWMKRVIQPGPSHARDVGPFLLLGFLVWAARSGVVPAAEVLPVVQRLDHFARRGARRLGVRPEPIRPSDLVPLAN
jgi:hypothetical protein